MNVAVYGRNVEVTPALRQYVEDKLSKLNRFFKGWNHAGDAQATLRVEQERHAVEVTISLNGYLLRGEAGSDDMYTSIDLVVDKLERQATRYKKRIETRRRQQSPALATFVGASPAADGPGGEAPLEEEVVKVKRFDIKPQTVEEALLQLNLLDHDFYLFHNSETDKMNVLYRRKQGGYGLIQPH